MQYMTEQKIDMLAGETGRCLAAEPRRTLTIAPLHGEPYWEGGINGHFFRIKTGVPVSVPESLARLIESGCRARTEGERRVSAFTDARGARLL